MILQKQKQKQTNQKKKTQKALLRAQNQRTEHLFFYFCGILPATLWDFKGESTIPLVLSNISDLNYQ